MGDQDDLHEYMYKVILLGDIDNPPNIDDSWSYTMTQIVASHLTLVGWSDVAGVPSMLIHSWLRKNRVVVVSILTLWRVKP